MSFEIAHPMRLLAIPICAAIVFLVSRIQKSRSLKEKVSHILRYVLIALTALAFAGTSLMTASPDRTAWLVLDLSASVREDEVTALARQALQEAGEDRKTGVIVFGRDATVEKSIGGTAGLTEIHAAPDRGGSDLGKALSLASALLPSDSNGGIAVISDGVVSGTEEWLQGGSSVPVNVMKISRKTGADAQVTDISVPDTLYQGQKYTTVVTVHSNTSGEATLLLSENHETPRTQRVTLRKGENTFAFESTATLSGVIPCEAQILMDGDTVQANNMNGTYTVVSGDMSVLIAEGTSGEGSELKAMLESAGMKVRTIPAAMLSENAADLWAYHAIALVNVDAEDLSDEQIEALDKAVNELGCGLAVFGGDSSYALGGYRGSALEKMLPVTIDVRNKMDLPTTALVICIDKSGSMAEASWGLTRLELAREAACSALEVLNERDSAGVIAFDDAGKWVVPLSKVTDVAAMQDQVRTIRLGGGTAFYSPLKMAYEALKSTDAQYKHVIFLTDGEAGDTGYESVVEEMAKDGITVTTVAVGDGADTAGMKKLAEKGNGRMYYAGPFDSLPKIFTKETMMISGSYVQNRTFTPAVTDETMTGFDGFPTLDGYLSTVEKPTATVSMCSDRQDPILAWWQYGAGRVVSWTSDVQGGWSGAFLGWEDAPAFFGGILSFVLPTRTREGEVEMEDGTLRFTAEADEALMSRAAKAEARITRPDGTQETVTLQQVSTKTFEGGADTDQSGAYAVHVTVFDRAGNELVSTDGGAVISWSREYDVRAEDNGALEKLTVQTGGKMTEDTAELLDFPDTSARKRRDLTPLLAILICLLFLFDVAQRRLDWIREPEKKEEKTEETPAVKAEKPKKEKKKKEQAPPQEKAADVLWENLQKKKRL